MKNELYSSFKKLKPDKELADRIDMLIDSAELSGAAETTVRTTGRKSIRRSMKVLIVAAVIMLLMAAAVSAYGVLERYFYMPGTGLVDDSGTLVVKEENIGDLDVQTYSTLVEFNFGEYKVDSVTYSSYNDLQSYTIWSTMSQAQFDQLKADIEARKDVSPRDYIIDDLVLVLPDGTEISPESVRCGTSGTIIYHFAAEKLDTQLTVSSAELGVSVNIVLSRVKGAGYSLMEYPTDNGVTLIISPTNPDHSEFKFVGIDDNVTEAFGENIYMSYLGLNFFDKLVMYDSSGNIIEDPTLSNFYFYLSKNTSFNPLMNIEGANRIARFEASEVALRHFVRSNADQSFSALVEIPEDGEYVETDIPIYSDNGFDIRLKAYSRTGNMLRVYITAPEQDDYMLGHLQGRLMDYNGDINCERAYADFVFSVLDAAKEHIAYGGYENSKYLEEEGLYCYSMYFTKLPDRTEQKPQGTLDSVEYLKINIQSFTFVYKGNWVIEY